MKTILFSVSVLALMSCCGTKKIAGDGTGQTLEMRTEKRLSASIGKVPAEGHATTIRDAKIDGNKLILDVSYGGGCQEHHFDLVGNEAISKSLPPIRSIHLVHTGEKDMCKALIMKTLEFDISGLAYKQEKGSEIILKLEGWDGELRYVYE
jgi:hypothetical protein